MLVPRKVDDLPDTYLKSDLSSLLDGMSSLILSVAWIVDEDGCDCSIAVVSFSRGLGAFEPLCCVSMISSQKLTERET